MANETKIVITAATARAEAALKSFTGQFKGMIGVVGGALSVGAFANLIKSSIELQDELGSLSAKTGISAKDLGGLKFAADQNGASLELVAKAAKELAVNMASTPDKFARLGITAKDATGALTQIADIVATMPDGMQKTALLAELMGKKVGPEMAEFLSQGGNALREYIAKGQQIYKVTDEGAAKAKEFKDQMSALQASVAGFGVEATRGILSPLTQIATAMADTAREAGLLKALLVGFGGVLTAVFTDDMLEREQKIAKDLKKLRSEQAHALQEKGNWFNPVGMFQGRDSALNDRNEKMLKLERELAEIQKQKAQLAAQEKPKTSPAGVADVLGANQKNGLEVLKSLERDYQNELAKRKDALNAPLLSASEKQLAEDLRAVHKRAQDARVELEKQKASQGLGAAEYSARLSEVTAKEQEQIKVVRELQAAQDELNRSFSYGAKTALREYMDEVENTAKQSKELMSASFKGMEDAIAKFYRTGSFNLEALKNQILDMLAQIAAKKTMAGLIGLFGGGGGYGDLAGVAAGVPQYDGGGFTGFGSRAGGVDGKGGFMAIMHPNETVIDHTKGQSIGGGMNVTYAPTIQIDARTDQAQVEQLVSRAVRQGNAELVDRLQRQGAI